MRCWESRVDSSLLTCTPLLRGPVVKGKPLDSWERWHDNSDNQADDISGFTYSLTCRLTMAQGSRRERHRVHFLENATSGHGSGWLRPSGSLVFSSTQARLSWAWVKFFTSVRSAPARLASVRLASTRVAFVRLARPRLASVRYCQLKSDWAVFLPWAGNLNA